MALTPLSTKPNLAVSTRRPSAIESNPASAPVEPGEVFNPSAPASTEPAPQASATKRPAHFRAVVGALAAGAAGVALGVSGGVMGGVAGALAAPLLGLAGATAGACAGFALGAGDLSSPTTNSDVGKFLGRIVTGLLGAGAGILVGGGAGFFGGALLGAAGGASGGIAGAVAAGASMGLIGYTVGSGLDKAQA